MSHPAIDQIIKTMALRDPEQFARLLFRNAKFKIDSAKLDKELRIRTRVVDQVFKLRIKRQTFLLHLEFLTRYKEKIAEDIYVYSAGLTNNYKLKTISVLFLVRPRAGALVSLGRYVVEPHGIETNAFTFPIIQHVLKKYSDLALYWQGVTLRREFLTKFIRKILPWLRNN